ncbi:SRP40 protein [Teladorsagia circumcincta]|uniref:SRP40 protein n=1 Tax=Teladorsagia circumcincta TaxID=45464 RepID=A0A2G9V041_TELCI|nr:SRP40 protein [Teladorsagia circumcincta]
MKIQGSSVADKKRSQSTFSVATRFCQNLLNFKRKSNEPFRRVTITKDSLPAKFKDNSYNKSHDQWGAKAHESLSKVQGKGFRHEKTKKKKVED